MTSVALFTASTGSEPKSWMPIKTIQSEPKKSNNRTRVNKTGTVKINKAFLKLTCNLIVTDKVKHDNTSY